MTFSPANTRVTLTFTFTSTFMPNRTPVHSHVPSPNHALRLYQPRRPRRSSHGSSVRGARSMWYPLYSYTETIVRDHVEIV